MKKLTALLCAVSLCVCVLSSCGGASRIHEPFDSAVLLPAGTAENDTTAKTNFTPALTHGFWTLLIGENTAEIAVTDSRSGHTWYSNPQQRPTDVGEVNIALLRSQLTLTYNDNGLPVSLNSFSDSVKKGQYRIKRSDDALSVIYTLGEVSEKKLVPLSVSKERFEKLILDHLDSGDARMINRRYWLLDIKATEDDQQRRELLLQHPEAADGPVYIMRQQPVPPNVEREIDAILRKTPYTFDDMDADNAVAGVEGASQKPAFNVEVRYSLSDEGLCVSVPADGIVMPADYLVETLAVLPFFGAASASEDGYTLLPDGSGSLLYHGVLKSDKAEYSLPLYGVDKGLYPEEQLNDMGQGTLPVFGMHSKGEAFLAVIDEGDASATVRARPVCSAMPLTNVYAEFRVREKQQIKLEFNTNPFVVHQTQRYAGQYRLTYAFLIGAEADYNGMARFYARCLFGEQAKSVVQPTVVELIGSIDDDTSILGIPVNVQVALTTFKQAEKLAREIKGKDINPAIMLSGWFNGGLAQRYAGKLKVQKELGGKKGFNSLAQALKEADIPLYPAADFSYVRGEGAFDGFSSRQQATRFINRVTATLRPFNPATFMQDTNARAYTIISPRFYQEQTTAFMAKYLSLECGGLAPHSLGRDLNADYNEKQGINRQEAQNITAECLGSLAKDCRLLLSGGNAYSLLFASQLVNAPLSALGFDVTDESVPFVPLVLSGHVPYTGGAYNLSGAGRQTLLRHIETGAGLYYTLCAADGLSVRRTEYEYLYSLGYDDWLDHMADTRKQLSQVFDVAAGTPLVKHEKLAPGVYLSTYQNGAAVAVNYGTGEYKGDCFTVGAEDFTVVLP